MFLSTNIRFVPPPVGPTRAPVATLWGDCCIQELPLCRDMAIQGATGASEESATGQLGSAGILALENHAKVEMVRFCSPWRAVFSSLMDRALATPASSGPFNTKSKKSGDGCLEIGIAIEFRFKLTLYILTCFCWEHEVLSHGRHFFQTKPYTSVRRLQTRSTCLVTICDSKYCIIWTYDEIRWNHRLPLCEKEGELDLMRQHAWVRHMEHGDYDCCTFEPA